MIILFNNFHDLQVTGPSQDDCNRTFVISDEDHTLGNALKHIIMQK